MRRQKIAGMRGNPYCNAATLMSAEDYALCTERNDAEQHRAEMERGVVRQRWEYIALGESASAFGAMKQCDGDILVNRIEAALAYLDTRGFRRSKHQRIFHRAFLSTSFGQLYGAELHQHLVRLLKETGWSELRSECICVTPRRFGKTVGVSLWCAVCLSVLRDHDISVYSNNSRASRMLLLFIYKIVRLLQENSDFSSKIVGFNKQEKLQLMTREGFVNTVYAYPARAETLRGTGSRAKTGTVILEELAFMPLDVVYDIVCPTLTRKNVNLIGITTLQDSDSFAAGMMGAKFPDGRDVFLNINFDLVCESCRAAGTPELCNHLISDIPYWQSQQQHKKLEAIMRDSLDVYMRELKGYQMDENVSPAFSPPAITALERPTAVYTQPTEVHHIFVSVDPACGGKYSKFAIVSAVYVGLGRDIMVIVGAESCKAKRPEVQNEKLVAHLQAVRRLPGLQTAIIVFVPENNLGFEAERMEDMLRRAGIPRVVTVDEDENRAGIRTTKDSKKVMAVLTNRLLMDRRMRFHKEFVCVDEDHTPEEMKALLIKELRQYQRILEPNKNDALSEPKEKFSGKLGGGCDDHAICVQLNVIGRNLFNNRREKYGQYHER